MIRFSVPVPPSVNAAYRNTTPAERARNPGGTRKKTKAYKEWQNAAGWRIAQQRPGFMNCYCAMSVWVPLARNRDLDNVQKLTQDLCVYMHILADDSQIDEVHMYRMPFISDAEMTVEIRPLENLRPATTLAARLEAELSA